MNMIKGHNPTSTTILLYNYTDGLRAICLPQRAMDGLSFASKQEPWSPRYVALTLLFLNCLALMLTVFIDRRILPQILPVFAGYHHPPEAYRR